MTELPVDRPVSAAETMYQTFAMNQTIMHELRRLLDEENRISPAPKSLHRDIDRALRELLKAGKLFDQAARASREEDNRLCYRPPAKPPAYTPEFIASFLTAGYNRPKPGSAN